MYEAFDDFLTTQTWHKHNHEDEEQFYCTLRTIINEPQFSAEKMRAYMLREAPDHEDAIDQYVRMAQAVSDYVRANC
jgi:hypothetical protein